MTTKRTQYERTSRDRATMKAAATLLGWKVLDVLGAYLTDAGDIVVITRDGQRLGARAETPASMLPSPVEVSSRPVSQLAKIAPHVWSAFLRQAQGRTYESVVSGLGGALDSSDVDPDLRVAYVRALELLEEIGDVPDWFDQLPHTELLEDDDE